MASLNQSDRDALCSHPHRSITSITPVYHVGDLDSERSKPYYNYEGRGLSISTHSDAWQQIARLSGDVYTLLNDQSEFYVVDPRSDTIQVERDLCTDRGYIKSKTGYKVSYSDPEVGEERYLLYYDRESAESEKDNRADLTDINLTQTAVYDLATNGEEYWREAFTKSASAADPVEVASLIPIFVALELSVDGVWWDHPVQPESYTAPRGTIFQPQLDNWHISINDNR